MAAELGEMLRITVDVDMDVDPKPCFIADKRAL
jgi:hypothetical protein